ncbi:uncharacterized protein ATNIH1004_011388 [Aspergillus tanneri]|uniref:Alcohol dehydrogenase-like C-terminal domain-containing protein n=1 Tax=Aspergillus tanneri TaxID=1220188 RepID=A0A5M9MAX5_9EURO|nr:uncharacterized protein ATNIH1004_011388 [Aspergillus tanneri]KAA8642444.1 hypothetical protein ATNIH1004_011388 [Aspergillus tanneri]
MAAIMTARLYSPLLIVAVDKNDARLEIAKRFRAHEIVNSARVDALNRLTAPTDGHRFDSVSVHGKKLDLPIKASLVGATAVELLLRHFHSGLIDASPLITHVFPFHDGLKVYDTCKAAAQEKAMNIIIDIGTL